MRGIAERSIPLTAFGEKVVELCDRAGFSPEFLKRSLPEDDQYSEWVERAMADPRAFAIIKSDTHQAPIVRITAEAWTVQFLAHVPYSSIDHDAADIQNGVEKELNKVFEENKTPQEPSSI